MSAKLAKRKTQIKNIAEKEVEYLVISRLKEKDRIKMALQKQDEIRQKHSEKRIDWNSVTEVRKWRNGKI